MVICSRAIYSVNAFTRYSGGAPRLIRLCGDAGYEYWGPRTGSGSVSTLSFWPLSPILAYILCMWVIARASTIPDLGYCRCNRRDCCGLPIIGRGADNPLSHLLSFLCSLSNALPVRAPLRAATAKFLILPSSRLRQSLIFLRTRVTFEEVTANQDRW